MAFTDYALIIARRRRYIDSPNLDFVAKRCYASFVSLKGKSITDVHSEEEEEDDGMEEIDTGNIVAGRTRGKNINWAEADQKAKEAGDDFDDDDDEDDEDFEDHESNDKDAMEE
jgi:TATA-binding protein-associated factor Taf7